MADLDVGGMFLNFVLHSDLRALCGVDLTKYGGTVEEFEMVAWEVWQWAAMILKPSAKTMGDQDKKPLGDGVPKKNWHRKKRYGNKPAAPTVCKIPRW
jgi:hypothetical protein